MTMAQIIEGEFQTRSLKSNFKDIEILVVNRTRNDLTMIRDFLAEGLHSSVKIDFARNLSEAFYKLKSNHYNICLTEYNIGTDTGLDLMKMAREEGILVPFTFITSQTDPVVAVKIMKAGATDYLSKHTLLSIDLCKSVCETVRKERQMARILEGALNS